jgi:PGF-CTERM protein
MRSKTSPRKLTVGLVVMLALSIGSISVAAGGAAVAQDASGELTFDNQTLTEDGAVTVTNVTTAQESTIVVTYTDGDQEIVAGVAAADSLDGEDVSVEVQDAGGFPGEHTAWVFDDGDLPADLGIGDDATPVAGAALDSDSAAVTQAPEGELTFDDQSSDGVVTVTNVTTAQPSTIVLTYTDDDQEIIVGAAPANMLDNEAVRIELMGAGGFPGEHTAWVFDNSDLPADLSFGDDATPVAGAALDSDSAAVTVAAAGELRFDDQSLGDDGAVTVSDVSTTTESTVVITYTDGDREVVAGVSQSNTFMEGEVNVEVQDAGGFPGEHTAWVFDSGDLPADLGIGDDATPVAGAALDSDSAAVTQAPEGELTFDDQTLAEDGTVSVTDVTTAQPSTVVVTYTDGDQEVVAGVAAADSIDGGEVNVEVQDAGGFPGEHTAWVFDDGDLPADLGIGDDATPVAGAALDSGSANVTENSDDDGASDDGDSEADDDGPGFGVVLAVIALVAAALVALRRRQQ